MCGVVVWKLIGYTYIMGLHDTAAVLCERDSEKEEGGDLDGGEKDVLLRRANKKNQLKQDL